MGKSVTDPLVELVGEEAYQGFEPWDFALDLAPVVMAYSFVSEALVNLISCRDRSFFLKRSCTQYSGVLDVAAEWRGRFMSAGRPQTLR